jgi:predicted DNA-binding protein
MAGRLYRTQILLEPEQHQVLAELAAREGRSISDVVREIIRAHLEQQQQATDAKLQQDLAALEQIEQHRAAILARRGDQPIDIDIAELIHQMWDEQDARNLSEPATGN